jgi:kumamolisin
MAAKSRLVSLIGSEREPLKGARAVGPVPADERIEVTVRVRRRQEIPAQAISGDQGPGQRHCWTHEELEQAHGADPKDLAQVRTFAVKHGLAVVETSAARRSIMLSGTAEALAEAFGVTLERYEHEKGTYRGRTGPVQLPAKLAPLVEGVFGLDNRPVARPHIRHAARAAKSVPGGYTPPQVAQMYNFPAGLDGQGQCIGIIELGGGFRPKDLKAYFAQLSLPLPQVTAVSVDGGQNRPDGPNGADGEVMLDIEVAGAVAPAAKIAVYFTPDASDRSFLDALTKAVHDTTHKPSVISISWGGPEPASTPSFIKQFNQVLHSASLLGITVCVAAGDNGAADEGPDEWDGQAQVDFPASSPYALACGGTRIDSAGAGGVEESVWNQQVDDVQDDSFGATGGGISQVFPVPAWQASLDLPASVNPGGTTGRGVPDVAGDADPDTGYVVRVDGQEFPIGGTSAVAPLWAGLIALLNQKLRKPVGYFQPWLYANAQAGIFRDVVHGNNKVGPGRVGYSAAKGWDPCTGLGSPNGAALLAALEDDAGG